MVAKKILDVKKLKILILDNYDFTNIHIEYILNEEVLYLLKNKINVLSIIKSQQLPMEFIRTINLNYFEVLLEFQNLSIEYINEHKGLIKKHKLLLLKYQILPEDFLIQLLEDNVIKKTRTVFYYIIVYQKVSTDFIQKYSHLMDWPSVSRYQDLDDNLLQLFYNNLIYSDLVFNKDINKVSEELLFKYFLRLFSGVNIFRYKQFSKEFLINLYRNYKKDFNASIIYKFQDVAEEVFQELKIEF